MWKEGLILKENVVGKNISVLFQRYTYFLNSCS